MASFDFRRNSPGIAEILRSPGFADAVADKAEAIAAHVRAVRGDVDVVVDRYVTDRAAASVTVRDRQALLWETRDGLLIRAAAAAGLEVRSR